MLACLSTTFGTQLLGAWKIYSLYALHVDNELTLASRLRVGLMNLTSSFGTSMLHPKQFNYEYISPAE